MVSDLVSTIWLREHLKDPHLVIADIRWINGQPDGGRNAHREARIPGAIFIDLDTELSDRSDLSRGRHPLPDPQQYVQMLAQHGIGADTHVIAYDNAMGSVAARLWWMMRWIGAPLCSVLDGGFERWQDEGGPVESGEPAPLKPAAKPVPLNLQPELIMKREELEDAVARGVFLLDARAPERYRGEIEPIDTRAGHIPGAINAPFANNLTTEKAPVYRNTKELRELYMGIGIQEDSDVTCYCGSGVTACHDILALSLAGFSKVKLYPGSWSEWIANTPD